MALEDDIALAIEQITKTTDVSTLKIDEAIAELKKASSELGDTSARLYRPKNPAFQISLGSEGVSLSNNIGLGYEIYKAYGQIRFDIGITARIREFNWQRTNGDVINLILVLDNLYLNPLVNSEYSLYDSKIESSFLIRSTDPISTLGNIETEISGWTDASIREINDRSFEISASISLLKAGYPYSVQQGCFVSLIGDEIRLKLVFNKSITAIEV